VTERHNLVQRIGARLVRAGAGRALCLVLIAGLEGCHHKSARPALPVGALAPIALEDVASPGDMPMIAEVPPPQLTPLPPAPPSPKPPPRRRPQAPPKDEAPVQLASGGEPAAALAIGALSTGGDAAPQSQQQARDLIASIQKRIAALPAKTAEGQKKQVRQVRNFLDQGQQALDSGDAEGAINLATKARLLMDDLEKK
jgi:hypothetical protein